MEQSDSTSNDTKTLITVLLLLTVYPIGVIVMWFWPSWPKWAKILISLPIIIAGIAVIATTALVIVNPAARLQQIQPSTPPSQNLQES